MSRTDKITPGKGLTIIYNGLFDFSKLYKDMHDWFIEYKYYFQEQQHEDKPKGKGRELKITWKGERNVDDYAKFVVGVYFFLEEFNKVENLDSGKLLVEISAAVVLDYKESWQAKPFGNFLFKAYNKYVIKKKIESQYYSKLYDEVLSLQKIAKTILDLYS